MIKKINIVLVALFVLGTFCMRETDKVIGPPGMRDTVVYSGFLDTYQNDRKLHYVFVQADTNPAEAPLAIWLNGGPGCSSLIGYMQQIGPYLVGDTYKHGQDLIKNQYRWNKAANVLFIESPGLVGFSTDTNPQINYSDKQTADDSFEAIKDFLWKVAPQFTNRQLFISGQSYAGKYIPDIAVRIINHNRQPNVTYINLKGILIGNGIMNHVDNSLTKSRIQYMIQHDFISERLLSVYRGACTIDFFSPRCQYFKYQFTILRYPLNYYNVYEVCLESQKSIQQIRTEQFTNKIQKKLRQMQLAQKFGENPQKNYSEPIKLRQINTCPQDQGMNDYLNMYKAAYNVFHINKTWTPCVDINYDVTVPGSMAEYQQIFLNKAVKVWMFSGDWDSVVPYPDTVYNLNLLKRKKQGLQQPWFVGQKHAGFYQMYDSVTLITIKGAGHWVPIFKPAAAYQMFYNFIKNRPINTPV